MLETQPTEPKTPNTPLSYHHHVSLSWYYLIAQGKTSLRPDLTENLSLVGLLCLRHTRNKVPARLMGANHVERIRRRGVKFIDSDARGLFFFFFVLSMRETLPVAHFFISGGYCMRTFSYLSRQLRYCIRRRCPLCFDSHPSSPEIKARCPGVSVEMEPIQEP